MDSLLGLGLVVCADAESYYGALLQHAPQLLDVLCCKLYVAFSLGFAIGSNFRVGDLSAGRLLREIRRALINLTTIN